VYFYSFAAFLYASIKPFILHRHTLDHVGFSTVTFSSFRTPSWARWILHRYLFHLLSPFSVTLGFPPLPFSHPLPLFGHVGFPTVTFFTFSPLYGHVGFSTVTFSSFRTPFRARWIFHRYLFHLLSPFSVTLGFPPLPFSPSLSLLGHAGFSTVTFFTLSPPFR